MKLSEEYLVKQIYSKYYLIPVGQKIDDGKAPMELNETSFFICSKLAEEIEYDDLINIVAKKYEASESEISKIEGGVDQVLSVLRDRKLVTV